MKKSVKTCPCGSGEEYEVCCRPYHEGKEPENALKLMRSRYSAYALNLPEYIIKTTHPGSPEYNEDHSKWKRGISSFSLNSKFENLEVLDFKEGDSVASVTFVAHVKQGKQDLTFTEKSLFEKIRGKWFYRAGLLMEGHAPNLVTVGQLRILPLAYYGNPILRKVAEEVQEVNESIQKLADEMIETMDACDGIGLAAPQVHHSIRLFVVREQFEKEEGHPVSGKPIVFINPKLFDPSEEVWKAPEGCLSVPTVHVEVVRPKEITVEYTNREGKRVRERFSGWMARVVQHENDHINGVLFFDHLSKEDREGLEPYLQRINKRIHDGTEL